ncbi:Mcat [Symbiodinium sp. KB8]|nr:Mcat [Symbiodinium sp. KB8]
MVGKPVTSQARAGIELGGLGYEPSWSSIPFEGYDGMTQLQFQESNAPYLRHGGEVPAYVPPGWRKVESKKPGKHLYVHLASGTISHVPVDIFDPKAGAWVEVDASKRDKKAPVALPPLPTRPAPAQASPAALPPPSGGSSASLPVALLFPGQGSQYVKMMAGVKDLPAVKEMLATANKILDFDLLELCLKGPEAELERTKFCQPAMYVAGLAGMEKLKSTQPEKVDRCQAVAGLSLGEYTALTAAGVFDFETGLKVVKLRGEAMQEAAEASQQAMLSVAGLGKEILDKLCGESVAEPGDVCQVANFLFPNGFSCAGTLGAIQRLEEKVKATAYDTCLTAIRFILAAVALNTRLSFPWQLLLSVGQIWSLFKSPGGLHHPGFSIFLQCVVLGLTILGSYTLETCVRSNIRAQFHGSDAESLMVSFRQLLRGICDGEVLLDSNLRIHSVSDCLKHLLMTSTNMHGKSFQQLLDPADLQKFREFMETSANQTEPKVSTPSCLHVSLLGAANTRIPVDLYHVTISKLYGSHDPYHLIALKEESEQRAPPGETVDFPPRHRIRTGSEGIASAAGLQALFGNLSEMSLLLDPATGCCDVHRAQLRFRHRPGQELNLRSIVLPTDWASIHEAVTQFSERQEGAMTTSYPQRLPAIRCRMLDRCSRVYNSAHLVELSAHSRISRKVWLRLGDLVEGTGSGERRHLQRVLPELRRSRSQTSI